MGRILERAGSLLMWAGICALGLVFVIVMINGKWPLFLSPLRDLFRLLSSIVGGWAFVLELIIFAGPGIAVHWLGRKLTDRKAGT